MPFSTMQWSWLQFTSEYQSTPRSAAAAAYLSSCYLTAGVSGPCFVVFGGTTEEGTVLNTADVLRLDNPAAPYWTEPPALTVGAPLPRFDHTLTAHYNGASAYVFGGTINGCAVGGSCTNYVTNELWQLAPAGFADAKAEEMINIINLAAFGGAAGAAASGGVPPVPAKASIFPSLDPLISSADVGALIDGVALDGVANTATTLAQAGVAGYNRCVFSPNAGSPSPWVQIDLGSRQNFSDVALFGQTDCAVYSTLGEQQECLSRMQGFQVFTGNDNTSTPATPWSCGAACGNTECAPPASPQFVGGRSVVACPAVYAGNGARFVWIVLPGAQRSIGLCEVQVLRKQRWAWRQLAGNTVNVALGRPATQTSQASTISGPFAELTGNGQGLLAFAAAGRAVDGETTNDARSQSCAVTDCNGNPDCTTSGVRPGAFQEWRVNLGSPQQVRYIQIWPAVFDGLSGPGHGGPLVLPNRTLNWYITAGNSLDPTFNTLCGGAPQDVSAYNQAADGSVTVPCVTQATFVAIRRYSGGADGGDGDDSVGVCEVQVWADQMVNTPMARGGHAATGFKGQLFVFGGYDASGLLLNDIYMFNMQYNRWVNANPRGVSPQGRTYAQLTVLNSQRLAISGGVAGNVPFKSVWSNLYAGCSGVDTTGVSSSYCTQGGSACHYTCYTKSNNEDRDGWLICAPWGGFIGTNPPCAPFAPSPPVSNPVATKTSPTSVRVSWSGGVPAKFYSAYTHDGSDSTELYDIFEDGAAAVVGGDPTTDKYWWYDPSANSTRGVVGGNSWAASGSLLTITAAPGMSCFSLSAGQSGCPFMALINPASPTAVPDPNNPPNLVSSLTNVAIDTAVQIANASLFQPSVTSGIGLVDYTTGLVQFILGLEYVQPYYYVVWQSFNGPSPGQFRVAVPLTQLPDISQGVQAYLRIERSAATNNAYEAFYKLQASESYLPLLRPARLPQDFFGNAYYVGPGWTASASHMLPALVVSNFESTGVAASSVFFTAGFDFFRVAAPTCALPGKAAIVSAPQSYADITGLTPGATYNFHVVSSNDPNAQGWGNWGAEVTTAVAVTLDAAPRASFAAMQAAGQLRLVSVKQPSFMTPGVATGGRASLANDGNAAQTQYNAASHVLQCVSTPVITADAVAEDPSLLAHPLTWTVDLGRVTDVKFLTIAVPSDYPTQMGGFRVYLTKDAAPASQFFRWNRAATCVEYDMPYTIGSATSFASTFVCDATGRFVTVLLQPQVGVQLSLCEVSVYAGNRCPPRNASHASITSAPAKCLSAGLGDVCTQACAPGYSLIYGAASATCQGERWDGADVICEPLCPAVPLPPSVTTCMQTTFYDDFNDAKAVVQSRWAPADPRMAFDSYWFYDTQNFIMEASSRKGCMGDMLLLSTRVSATRLSHAFTFETAVKGRDAAGIAFRVVDKDNYYRFVIDSRGMVIELHAIKQGAKTVLASWPATRLSQDVYYNLHVRKAALALAGCYAVGPQTYLSPPSLPFRRSTSTARASWARLRSGTRSRTRSATS